jgi:uncharacterized protein
MLLEGVVTNVAAFGAFVDVGVHQDGLVHVSAMSRNFVSDPREVAKPGDVVRVKVLSVDIPRQRISLTLRLDDDAVAQNPSDLTSRPGPGRKRGAPKGGESPARGTGAQPRAGQPRGGQPRGGQPRGGQPRGGQQQGGQQQGDRPAGNSQPANSAMADALRRAGLTGNGGRDGTPDRDRRRSR